MESMRRSGNSQVVVITGASAGIGRATAQAFARRGSAICLVARGTDRLEQARREVEELGGHAIVFPADVSDPEQVEAAAEAAETAFGPIDIWVNDAMVTVFSPAVEMTADEFKRVTDVTYLGFVWGTLAALRRMRPRNSGVVVQVGSALAYRGIPLQSAYCACKHAIQGFTESVRCELLHEGSKVRICMVQMPALNTPQFTWVRNRMPHKAQPVPPIYQPEVAADAIVYAATHRRWEIYVGWPTVKAIVGNKLAPRLLDRYLGWMGYKSQQRHEPVETDRPDNLMSPLPGDYGAHGAFDHLSRKRSLQLWATKHRSWILAGFAGLAVGAGLYLGRERSNHRHAYVS
jgi:NAD(P)-dependent dehydrogenase (short-subunit alcohol dehydrogenase family)